MFETDDLSFRRSRDLPVQELLDGEYIRIVRLHKDINHLSVIPHRHDHYELMLVTAGTGIHAINFKTFDIQPGRLYFIHPGQVHLIAPFDRDGWLIMFGEELFKRFLKIHPHEDGRGLLDAYASGPYIDLHPQLSVVTNFIIEQLRIELARAKPDVDIILHYVSLLLLQYNQQHQLQHPLPQASHAQRELLHKLKQLIERNFRQEHQAAFYATCLRTDIKKLNNICRASTGLTVFELLQERMVTESKILLQTSVQSVKEISYELGFNDPAFFGRFFKKHTGLTPAAFRQSRSL
jgi:AraC-like DNA-binding protein